ncbi:MAG TPA: trifunctional serine/threonine-protein kinase/ATP-binding protein/sensor histidine kinase [Leptospiraceae bacterium]|nr:trifunctional serine/threonine-protein kinase/ATP-binding protein/sensor histidine kinase [Leptospiraceae bacterium]
MILQSHELLEKIYESNNSIIYRAKRKEDGNVVVIKVLNDKYPPKEKIAKFQYEFEILKNLNINGVIKVIGLAHLGNSPVIIEEEFRGLSLNHYIPQNLDLSSIIKIFIEVTTVIGKIHEANIIHKDINPSNILWSNEDKQIKIIDFGISSQLSLEKSAIQNPDLLEGTLNYIAPEQTGRMNRPIDYRADFYSLGATFYELLTKQIPFINTKDSMELVHCHIAKQPLAPHEVNKNIPPILSKIILKLMAKNAEDRYQSAIGLQSDLQKCLDLFKTIGKMDDFEICKNDRISKFQIPQTLYGRETEVKILLDSFKKVCDGNTEMVLISGFSGIGKTALINEVQKPIVEERGYFTSGKFDQFQRNIPYSAIIQSFRGLVKQILTESSNRIQTWKEEFKKNLGSNGQVIINVIPELELIIGKQEAIQELPPSESQNRFNFVFQNFVNTFTKEGNPLVVFIDDLQWADNASLQLIQLLIANLDNKFLFFIGAYRDNETDKSHPLVLTIDSIEKAGSSIKRIHLKNLEISQVNQLVSDSLNSSLERTKSLSELVFAKTEGNPFFINELLRLLSKEKIISFDNESSVWNWDLIKIQELGVTDNVVDLLTGRIQKLSPNVKEILTLAACIGNYFDLKTLSILIEKSKTKIATELWEALEGGFILPLDDSYKFIHDMEDTNPRYKFIHDRIQQAAFQLIPTEQKETVHLKFGRLLIKHLTSEEREEKLFDITNHLNLAKNLITDTKEKEELIKFNLQAGKKAKQSAAFIPALEYFKEGIQLLDRGCWTELYSLSIELFTEAADTACVNAEFDTMGDFAKQVLANAKTNLEKVKISDIQIKAYMAGNNPPLAIKTALDALSILGVNVPEKPSEADIGAGIGNAYTLWNGKQINSLIDLPEMKDLEKLMALQIISTVMPITYVAAPMLVPMLAFAMLELSINYGNTHASAFGYASYGLVLCAALGDVDNGNEFGQLAINLVDRLDAKEFKARTYAYTYMFISHWKYHLVDSLVPALKGYQIGLETGDITNSALNALLYGHHAYIAGKELNDLAVEMENFSLSMKKLKQDFILGYNELYRYAVLSWIRKSEDANFSYQDTYYEKMVPILKDTQNFSGIWIIYLNKMIFSFVFEKYSQAYEESLLAEPFITAAQGAITPPLFFFYQSLTLLALYGKASEEEKKLFMTKVIANQEKMSKWAEKAPMNFQHKFYLVEGEKARVLIEKDKALEFYDKAISLAKGSKYIQEEALANEIAGKFWLESGKEEFARVYIQKAFYLYQFWGSPIKCEDLNNKYEDLIKVIIESKKGNITSTSTTSGFLDVTTILKSSQIISGEIVLENLLTKMISILIENAGAERGLLLLEKNKGKKDLLIQAEGFSKKQESIVLQNVPFKEYTSASHAIIQYVANTEENVVLEDACKSGLFTKDPYILERKILSVLCFPILHQNKFIGIIYLENNLTSGAFTEQRIEILNVLSAQAAISIENSLLYANLEEKVLERTKQLEQAHEKILVLEKETTEKQLAGGFAHEMRNALVGPKLVIQHVLGQDGSAPFESLSLANSRKLKEIYLLIKDKISEDTLNSALKEMKVIFENEEQMENSLNMIYKSVSKGLLITQQIMDYAKVGNEQVGKSEVDINHLLESLVEDYEKNWTEHKINISLNLPKEKAIVQGLDSHFESVFKNLLLNAKDALIDKNITDKREKKINIKAEKTGYNYRVEITDNGIGISPEHIGRIYDAFFSTKPDSGTGLGLGVVKKIVTLYNGKIEVSSELGKGTTFTATLPLVKASTTDEHR